METLGFDRHHRAGHGGALELPHGRRAAHRVHGAQPAGRRAAGARGVHACYGSVRAHPDRPRHRQGARSPACSASRPTTWASASSFAARARGRARPSRSPPCPTARRACEHPNTVDIAHRRTAEGGAHGGARRERGRRGGRHHASIDERGRQHHRRAPLSVVVQPARRAGRARAHRRAAFSDARRQHRHGPPVPRRSAATRAWTVLETDQRIDDDATGDHLENTPLIRGVRVIPAAALGRQPAGCHRGSRAGSGA